MTILEHLRRELHELEHLAANDRDGGDFELAVWHEAEAAAVGARIDTLERADGLAYGIPMDGAAA